MKQFKEKLIVGIDHGYGNIKTANHCFKTGIMGYDAEPLFTKDMLEYGGRYYLIGEGHKEFLPDKIKDEDYYLLTLVAIAEELKDKGLTEANVIIAAGLPLTWTSGQKNEFAAYLSKNEEVSFTYQRMMQKYEKEQRDLTAEVENAKAELQSADQKTVDLRLLLKTVREITEVKELTSGLIHSLIERIEVHNNDKYDGHCHVKVDIYFSVIGMMDIPDEKEIQAMMEEVKKNPQKYRYVA